MSFSEERMAKTLCRLMDVAATTSGCVLWPLGRYVKGYGVVRQGSRYERAHRVLWALKHGTPPPSEAYIRHTCGNKQCVQPSHLYLDNRERSPQRAQSIRERRRALGRVRKGNTLYGKTIEQGRLHNGTSEIMLRQLLEEAFHTNACVLWPYGQDSKGYGVIKVGKQTERIHRYVWRILHRHALLQGECVKHSCDIKNCIQPQHLFLGR